MCQVHEPAGRRRLNCRRLCSMIAKGDAGRTLRHWGAPACAVSVCLPLIGICPLDL